MQMPEYSGGGGDGKKWNYSSSMCSNSNSKCTRSSVNNAVVDDDSDITTTVTTTLKVTNSSCCRRSIMAVSEAAIGSRSVATMFIVFASVLLLITVTDVRASSSSNYVVPTTPMTPDVVSSTVIPAAIIKESQNRSANSNNGRWYSKLSTGNELWDGIIQDCYHRPMISCFQKNVYTFLDGALDSSDVNVTGRLKLFKNKVDYTKYTVEANNGEQRNHQHGDGDDEHLDETNEIPNESRAAESPIEEVTNALYGKSVKFVMTHDVELKLPEMVFDGATFRISPRSIEGNGAIVKLELVPKAEVEARDAGKFFIKKKIQKFFKSKLMLSFLALILILKIIKIKIFWLLPLIVGVGTAKKLLLKFLLFLFPALSHLFKLCSYYQQEYHSTKYHHHHHLINHHHTIVPPWHHAEGSAHIPNIAHVSHGPPPHGHGHGHGHAPEIIYTDPPKVHPSAFLHGAHGHGGTTHDDYGANDWVSSGPGLGSDFVQGKVRIQGPVYVPQRSSNVAQQAPSQTAAQIAAQYDPNRNKQITPELSAQVKEALRIEAEKRIISQQQEILDKQPFIQGGPPIMPKNYDEFYTPILDKIDKILGSLGFVDNHCKERLTCSMYKNPIRFSPHSNFLSAELSRDTSELQTPDATNPTVIRFYRLVDAARNGQEQRDCLRLYAQCSVNTEL
ncbi:uncharacterized protein LOC129914487 isoform X2 [Episyrphus balteatus]|uniref:uncharacterized protein LOC129914487 isoform X2 n=1 Tax=Episyrphus balteatus TaxID=286459 RepID=UPI0024851012|nr:uncharacterized protein LOC129914487 isoform X2 [Episyrphus balteatus]